jgi:hypothetical protein
MLYVVGVPLIVPVAGELGERLAKRRDAASPAQSFLASWQEKCRFGGGHFVAGVRAGRRPAPDERE